MAIGLPLIFLKQELPAWLESGAEKAIGIVILALALRVIYKWVRGDFRAGRHRHAEQATDTCARGRERSRPPPRAEPAAGVRDRHPPRRGRHGRGRTATHRRSAESARGRRGPRGVRADVDRLDGLCTGAFAWVLTRPLVEPVYRTVLIPGLGVFGVMFGLWYAGLA